MFVRNGDIDLYVTEAGDPAAPPIVLLHGIIMSQATWEWLVPHLQDRFRVVRMDFRGHGGSARAPGRYDLDGYVRDAEAVCEWVGSPAIVIGHSLGGGTAAALAQQRPDLVRGLVLVDPGLAVSDRAEREQAEVEAEASEFVGSHALGEGFKRIRELAPGLQASGISVDDLATTMQNAPTADGRTNAEVTHEDATRALAEGMLQMDPTVLDMIVDPSGVAHTVGYRHTEPIKAPTLLLAGDPSVPDTITRPIDRDRLAAICPDVEIHVFPGAGHMVHTYKDHRDAVLAHIEGFLARV